MYRSLSGCVRPCVCTSVPRYQLGKSWSQKGHFRPAVFYGVCSVFRVVGCGQRVLSESSMCSEGKS